jgi:hypothetical protein
VKCIKICSVRLVVLTVSGLMFLMGSLSTFCKIEIIRFNVCNTSNQHVRQQTDFIIIVISFSFIMDKFIPSPKQLSIRIN